VDTGLKGKTALVTGTSRNIEVNLNGPFNVCRNVIPLMLHLASENAGFITGQCYLVNGGAYFS